MAIKLNQQQEKAVRRIYGPTLVVAGPGTGKTQLLSAKIAYILQNTDTAPSSILCLTYTENAAFNMRDRLSKIIPESAHEVGIYTYHGFALSLIQDNPDYFVDDSLEAASALQELIDLPAQIDAMTKVINNVSISNGYHGRDWFIEDLIKTVSEFKQSLMSADDLRNHAAASIKASNDISPLIESAFMGAKSSPSSLAKAEPIYSNVLKVIKDFGQDSLLITAAGSALEKCLEEATQTGRSTPLTKWGRDWLIKNANHSRSLGDPKKYKMLGDFADVFQAYTSSMNDANQFDYDDMILRVINKLSVNADALANIQEKYQHILLDEFQDTNAAQYKMINLIASHPVHEGSPDIMAVGDDDQAIFVFQGAEVTNMSNFIRDFKGTEVINLTDSYRLPQRVLEPAIDLVKTIQTRLTHNQGSDLQTKSTEQGSVQSYSFNGPSDQYGWIAESIQSYSGKLSEVAVIAPKHKHLQDIAQHLQAVGVPANYDRRDNLLDAVSIKQIYDASKLVIALANQDLELSNELMPQVLSQPYWGLDLKKIWSTNWEWYAGYHDQLWGQVAEKHPDLAQAVNFYTSLASIAVDAPLEIVVDHLTGQQALSNDLSSPFKAFYTDKDPDFDYVRTVAQLVKLREALRSKQKTSVATLKLADLVDFIDQARRANLTITDSHPINQAGDAVSLLTTYGAKGLEFDRVYMINVTDDNWGSKARGKSNTVTLPMELKYVRYSGSDMDELKRKAYVAMTRSKQDLILTKTELNDSGKQLADVIFLQSLQSEAKQVQLSRDLQRQSVLDSWSVRNVQAAQSPGLAVLLKDKIQNYQLSPTNLGTFIDLQYAGPQSFLLDTLLRFPSAASSSSIYGTAVHYGLELFQKGASADEVLAKATNTIDGSHLLLTEKRRLADKLTENLTKYLALRRDYLLEPAIVEQNFKNEAVVLKTKVGNARLTGKIDRLEINKDSKEARVIDFKTGSPAQTWGSTLKHLKYKYQLMFYKYLVENSINFKNYTVTQGIIEFTEPDKYGDFADPLVLKIDDQEYADFKLLIAGVWQRIYELNLDSPGQTSNFKLNKEFIAEIIDQA